MSSEQPKEGHGPWKDERRGPGFFPQGRRRPLAIVSLVVVAIFARVLVHNVFDKTTLGVFVILIGLGSFWGASRMNEQRLADERYMRGPGWFVGWLISKTSVTFARAFYVVLGIGICGLGIAALAV